MDRRHGAAFTLIELLVVIIIIAIIISITLPALGLARNAAKKAATDAMMRQITNAAATFQTDNRRMPGYFTAAQMGAAANDSANGGMSAMQNVILDLSGFRPLAQAQGGIRVGPDTTMQGSYVDMDPKSLGLPGQGNTKAYWTADIKHLVAQDSANQQIGSPNNAQLPSVVDEWGDPILAWVADDTALGNVKTLNQFAAQYAMPNSAPSLFYWASNACFLNSDNFGKRGQNNASSSMLGPGLASNLMQKQQSLAGLLGNPNYPYKDPNNTAPNPYDVPASPRGPLVLQSAGTDGIIASKTDRGAKQFAWGVIDYRYSFAPNVTAPIATNNQWTDTNGSPKNIDVMTRFDDLLAVGGN